VTREPGLEIDATISPDGKLVAYAAGPLGATKIYVKQVTGGRPIPLADLPGEHRFPRWSPDGTRISFLRSLPDGWEAYIVPALGGAPRRFPAPGLMLDLVWSPGGERIAYTKEGAIFVGPADPAEAKKLCDVFSPASLSWSPEGKRIAFTSGNQAYLFALLNAAPSSIWVVDVERREPVRVTEDVHLNYSPLWTADGRSLLFVSDRGGSRDIYRIPVGASGEPLSEPERLTTGLDVFTIASSTDGRVLSYSVVALRQNIWSLPVPLEGPVSVQEARPVTTGNQIIERVDVSADREWLVFDSNRSGNQDIFKMPVGGGEPVQLTTDLAVDCCASWSPDGEEVAFHSFRTGNRDIFVVPADGGTARQLTNDPTGDFYPHWSPDGTRVAFARYRSGFPLGIFVLSKDKGEISGELPVQSTSDDGDFARWSPDGRLIAYGRGEGGVAVVPPEGGASRRLTDFGTFPLWSKDSQTIYFKESRPSEPVGIWSIPISGGEPRLLVRFDDLTRQPRRPEWSTDGENFYFTLTEFEADVWVMELEDSRK
jgi:TolB protein